MKLPRHISRARRQAGILLTECLVYISVFAILFGIATTAFYFCWDHTRAIVYATQDIAVALHAGEQWRADVRSATGKISVETSATGEVVRIPETGKVISYRFEAGEVRREIASSSQVLLAKVKTSQVRSDARGSVNAWRWELQLNETRKETHLPLMFTFAAVPIKP